MCDSSGFAHGSQIPDGRNARKILERAVSEGSHLGYQRAVEVATRQLINLKTR